MPSKNDVDIHPRSLRRNIWRALLSATDQEIHEGMHFYEGAHGLCRFFSRLHPDISPSHIAGIYSALSPMNTWDTNVSNILDVLRDWSGASVNTTDINLHKALQIRLGADPLSVLKGRKVTAFYRAIAEPYNPLPIPVDRHLINLALGIFPDKSAQAALASDDNVYSKVEAAYHDLGKREGIGNRLASIAWFVQRRISRSGQAAILHPDSPVCCGRPMWSHGIQNGWRRFHCRACGITRSARPTTTAAITVPGLATLKLDSPVAYSLSVLQSAPIVYLPRTHPHRNSAGWQYLARHITMEATGSLLRRDEHVHHVNGDKFDCRINNLKVMLAESHGRFHARAQLLYMVRDQMTGQFKGSDVPRYRECAEAGAGQEGVGEAGAEDYSDIPF